YRSSDSVAHPPEEAAEPAARRERAPLSERAAADGVAQRGVPVVHRPRLLRLCDAERDSPQRPRESRLVHAVIALTGRDRAGAPRGAPQLPDDGARFDGDGGGERIASG